MVVKRTMTLSIVLCHCLDWRQHTRASVLSYICAVNTVRKVIQFDFLDASEVLRDSQRSGNP